MVRLDAKQVDLARLCRGWTWNDLVREARFSPPTVCKVKRGEPVSIVTARRVCEALGLRLPRVLILDKPGTAPQTTSPGAINKTA